MNIKIMFVAMFTISGTCGAFAQTSDAEADAVINLLGVQKREAIGRLVSVSGKDSLAFWKLYDDYSKTNRSIAKDRMRLYEETAHAYSGMSPAVADSLASRYFKNRVNQEKSLEEYYKKIKAATSPIIAFEFYQAEVYLLTQIRASIMQQIPTYGQLEATRKNK
jgi:hypothetical protein